MLPHILIRTFDVRFQDLIPYFSFFKAIFLRVAAGKCFHARVIFLMLKCSFFCFTGDAMAEYYMCNMLMRGRSSIFCLSRMMAWKVTWLFSDGFIILSTVQHKIQLLKTEKRTVYPTERLFLLEFYPLFRIQMYMCLPYDIHPNCFASGFLNFIRFKPWDHRTLQNEEKEIGPRAYGMVHHSTENQLLCVTACNGNILLSIISSTGSLLLYVTAFNDNLLLSVISYMGNLQLSGKASTGNLLLSVISYMDNLLLFVKAATGYLLLLFITVLHLWRMLNALPAI